MFKQKKKAEQKKADTKLKTEAVKAPEVGDVLARAKEALRQQEETERLEKERREYDAQRRNRGCGCF